LALAAQRARALAGCGAWALAVAGGCGVRWHGGPDRLADREGDRPAQPDLRAFLAPAVRSNGTDEFTICLCLACSCAGAALAAPAAPGGGARGGKRSWRRRGWPPRPSPPVSAVPIVACRRGAQVGGAVLASGPSRCRHAALPPRAGGAPLEDYLWVALGGSYLEQAKAQRDPWRAKAAAAVRHTCHRRKRCVRQPDHAATSPGCSASGRWPRRMPPRARRAPKRPRPLLPRGPLGPNHSDLWRMAALQVGC